MDLLLVSQKADKTIMQGEGGGYYTWSSSQFPLLRQKKLAAGVLVLHPRGFALPHYADSSKFAYVCEGDCMVGLVSPENSREEVIQLRKGDSMPVTLGVVSWWYNGGDSKVTIVFLGESDEYTPGEFNYFILTGAVGILNGFSSNNDVISKSFHMTDTESENFIKAQSKLPLISKIEKGTKMPAEPCGKSKLVFNLDIKHGGIVTCRELPLLEKVGLSVNHVVLEGGSVFGPVYTADSSVQLSYVTKGSGRIKIVGVGGQIALDTKVGEGHLFFVPKFFPYAVEADGGGIEFFSVITSSKQEFGELGGKKSSVWEALSPSILGASLNMAPDAVQYFKSHLT